MSCHCHHCHYHYTAAKHKYHGPPPLRRSYLLACSGVYDIIYIMSPVTTPTAERILTFVTYAHLSLWERPERNSYVCTNVYNIVYNALRDIKYVFFLSNVTFQTIEKLLCVRPTSVYYNTILCTQTNYYDVIMLRCDHVNLFAILSGKENLQTRVEYIQCTYRYCLRH